MKRKDVTTLIERMPEMESRFGVEISGLFGYIEDHGEGDFELKVMGELKQKSKSSSDGYLQISLMAYDPQGRVIATSDVGFSEEDFCGLAPIQFSESLVTARLARIRIFPRK